MNSGVCPGCTRVISALMESRHALGRLGPPQVASDPCELMGARPSSSNEAEAKSKVEECDVNGFPFIEVSDGAGRGAARTG